VRSDTGLGKSGSSVLARRLLCLLICLLFCCFLFFFPNKINFKNILYFVDDLPMDAEEIDVFVKGKSKALGWWKLLKKKAPSLYVSLYKIRFLRARRLNCCSFVVEIE
jgi:hypothetical protein